MKVFIVNNDTKTEVTLPTYKEYGNSFFRIESNRRYTQVTNFLNEGQLRLGIETYIDYEGTVSLLLLDGKNITQRAFDKAYEIALSYITRNEFIESTEPATEEEVREKITANMFVDDLPY